jgi:cell division protease FtsH
VRRLIDDAHRHVTELLAAHRPQLEALAHALLQAETLEGIDAYRAAGLPIQENQSRAA